MWVGTTLWPKVGSPMLNCFSLNKTRMKLLKNTILP